jgi:hypothetical protein
MNNEENKPASTPPAQVEDLYSDAMNFFESKKMTFTGMQAGDYLDREDFEVFARSLPASPSPVAEDKISLLAQIISRFDNHGNAIQRVAWPGVVEQQIKDWIDVDSDGAALVSALLPSSSNESDREDRIDEWKKIASELSNNIEEIQTELNFQLHEKDQRIKELEQWKREAISVTPDMQAIGKALNIPLGQSVHDKILPGIERMKERIEELEQALRAKTFGL